MAANSSKSTPSADSYVGSLISLISKSEIRYEGILFNVNTAESSIGLRNVKSFGTEGRKIDGPQLPPSEKVYEYILFRGTDIKDLQVKSSPLVRTTEPMYNDPAIIQSHYPQEAAISASFPSTGTGSQQDFSSYNFQVELPKPTLQSSVPLYQPSGSSGSWVASHPSGSTNESRLPKSVYMQGFYGTSDGLQTQQQTFPQQPTGLLMPPSMQPTMQYPAMSSSIPSRAFNLPASPLSEAPPPLLPSFSTASLNLHSSLVPAQTSAVPSDSSISLMTNKTPTQALYPAVLNASMPLANPPTTVLDKNAFAAAGLVQPKTLAVSVMSYNSTLESENPVAGASGSFLNKGLTPSLVTPNQFFQPGPTTVSSSQSSQSVQKDVEVVQISLPEQPLQTLPEAQALLLPLPSSSGLKVGGNSTHADHNNRGHGRSRGHWASHNAIGFTEDFDFEAMNEKFNKDEVWGHLGKNNTAQDDGYTQNEEDAGVSNIEIRPVYVKDDFFDSLSSNASDRGSRNGRTKFSEQLKLDTETFGNFARHRGGRGVGRDGRGFDRGGRGYGRGGWGYGRGGQWRGAHYERSYGYNERGGWGHHAT